MDENRDRTASEMGHLWGGNLHQTTILRYLKNKLHEKKKSYLYRERKEDLRKSFQEELRQYDVSDLVYLDETGIHENVEYEYSWGLKGRRQYGERPGRKGRRINVIAG